MNRVGEDDLDKLERETKDKARTQVANLLQRPDQLERVEQYKKKYLRKKAAAEAHLKVAVQSQLGGVKTGLSQLRACSEDYKIVNKNFAEIQHIYASVSGLKDKFVDLSKESARHRQYATAVETFKHVSKVPDLVRKTHDNIVQDELLEAHKDLADLEASRDQLLLDLHRQKMKSEGENPKYEQEADMLRGYFQEVPNLSKLMAKQLNLTLSRTLETVRQRPDKIVTACRIIERETRADEDWKRRHEAYGYMPPDRPKNWRSMAMGALADVVQNKLEACQLEDRSQHKMWLVRHLEIIRRTTIEDLKVVKSLCEPCFPKGYDIVRTYVKLYHTAISQHLLNVIDEGLEGNEIISLLDWISKYYSDQFMGHRGLEIREGDLGPLLASDIVEGLQKNYLNRLKNNISEWMSNSLTTDKTDWFSEDTEPESDGRGYFITQLPVMIFGMVDQSMQVAQLIGDDVIPSVLDIFLSEISSFANLYEAELLKYREAHLKDTTQPRFYIPFVIGNINNCDTLSELTEQLKTKYSGDNSPDRLYSNDERDRYKVTAQQFNKVAENGCLYLKEEVFSDLSQFIKNILTRDWLESEIDVGTICLTIEDYHVDFLHLRKTHFNKLMLRIFKQIIISYLRQLLSPSRKIRFASAEERRKAAEKIVFECEQIVCLFKKLVDDVELSDEVCCILPALAELLKMGDTTMMTLELSAFKEKYPDVKPDQLVNLLQLREDTDRSEAQKMISDSIIDQRSGDGVRKTILSLV